jgi:hypothetical protein
MMEHWWNDTDGSATVLQEKPIAVPLCPPQISNVLAWQWTCYSTTCTMEQHQNLFAFG